MIDSKEYERLVSQKNSNDLPKHEAKEDQQDEEKEKGHSWRQPRFYGPIFYFRKLPAHLHQASAAKLDGQTELKRRTDASTHRRQRSFA